MIELITKGMLGKGISIITKGVLRWLDVVITAIYTEINLASRITTPIDLDSRMIAGIDLQGTISNFSVNEGSGQVIYDRGYSNYKGILEDGVTFGQGIHGDSLSFDGTGNVQCRINYNGTKYSGNPVVVGQTGQKGTYFPNLIDIGDEIWMYFSVLVDADDDIRTGLSKSTDGGETFTYFGIVLDTSASDWDSKRAHDVCVIEDGGTYKMWYAGSDDDVTSEIGYATSPDGEVWTKQGIVFEKGAPGDFDEAGVTYMTVLKENGTYYMWYSGYDDILAYGGMGLATSADGITWTRVQTTPVLAGTNWYKGVVKKYNDVYYMLFSTSFISIYLYIAYSTDRINWTINYHPIIEKSLTPADWDGMSGADAGWYSINETEAKIYYSAYKTPGLDDSIGLITIPDLHNRAQETEILNQYPISICCWIKTTDSGTEVGIIKKGTYSPNNFYGMYLTGGRLKAYYVPDGSNYVLMIADGDDGGIINDGLWHHIIFIVDASGGEIFIDLVSQNTKVWTGTSGPITSYQWMEIGEYNNILIGSIDDIRIYDHALSSGERYGVFNGLPSREISLPSRITTSVNMESRVGF